MGASRTVARVSTSASRGSHRILHDHGHGASLFLHRGCVWHLLGVGDDDGVDRAVFSRDIVAVGHSAADGGGGIGIWLFDLGGGVFGVDPAACGGYAVWEKLEAKVGVYER